MNGWSCIILGVTGDLSHRKLLPALYHTIGTYDFSCDDVMICGAAYEEASFATIWDEVREHLDSVSDERIAWLKDVSWYHAIDFTSEDGFHAFAQKIAQQERKHGLPSKRMVYLAIPANFFCQVTGHLVEAGIVESGNQVHRIVYEKPFGWSLESAREINACIERHHLHEEQVYRVDHYLTKEFISNILLLRFTNRILDATWHRDHIKHIEITCKESIGIAGRGGYYDQYGAIRDMIQSHMLQTLALTAMECPDCAVGRGMEDEKVEVLRNTRFINGVRGQYVGYKDNPDVADDSTTETAAMLELRVDTPRWRDVPWYMFTGKSLDEKITEIRVVYQPSQHTLFCQPVTCDPDVLTIRIAPETGFVLEMNSKRPNSVRDVMPVTLDFCHSCQYAPYTTQAYEALLQSVFAGEQSISVTAHEIEAQWKLAEQALHADLPLYRYDQGSTGDQLRDIIMKG